MESKYTYQITHKAKADLDGIVSYIAIDLSNKEAAAKLLQMIQQTIESICSFPLSGAVLINDFLPNINIRKKICGNYILYYMVAEGEKKVYILRIIYGKRNLEQLIYGFFSDVEPE